MVEKVPQGPFGCVWDRLSSLLMNERGYGSSEFCPNARTRGSTLGFASQGNQALCRLFLFRAHVVSRNVV